MKNFQVNVLHCYKISLVFIIIKYTREMLRLHKSTFTLVEIIIVMVSSHLTVI